MSSCVGQLRSSAIGLAEHFDASALSAPDAVQAVDDLAVIRNIVDGLLGAVAKRVEDTGAHISSGALDAPTFVARMTHTPVRAVRE